MSGPYIVGWGGGGGGGARGQLPPTWKTDFSNIVFEFAELFLAAILVQNHKKFDLLTEKIPLQKTSNEKPCLYMGDSCEGCAEFPPPPPP